MPKASNGVKITIKTKKLELTPAFQTFVEKKIGTVKKFINILKQDTPEGLKTLAEVLVEVEKENQHHRKGDIFFVKIRVALPGKTLTVNARGEDISKAIVEAREELKTEIGRYKLKHIDKTRRAQRKAKESIKN